MKGHSAYIPLIIFLMAFLAFLPGYSNAQYWFQSGVTLQPSLNYNNGAQVSIETVSPQSVPFGSFGFWIGENLNNGAFLQIGYLVPNASGYYQTNCTVGGCSGKVYLKKGFASWFWEYFPSGYSGTKFFGRIGGNSSVGGDGTFNEYGFRASGNVWNFYINNVSVGSTNLGTSDSGQNSPSVVGEYADANTNSAYMIPVEFKNIVVYTQSGPRIPGKGYSYLGYGKGSLTNLPNNYGVSEVNNQTDFFEVGSGLPTNNNALLWSTGYRLNIISEYSSTNESGEYSPYSNVQLHTVGYVNVSKGVRAVFSGWSGSGIGSYTGPVENITISVDSNITEVANWQIQYFLNVSTNVSSTAGSGWYNSGSVAHFYIVNSTEYFNPVERYAFSGWSDGAKEYSSSIVMDSPKNISAVWELQYLLNGSTKYGKISGLGWYDNGSVASIGLNFSPVVTSNSSKISFYMWNNGATKRNFSFVVNSSVDLIPEFKEMYLVRFVPENYNGEPINASAIYIDGEKSNLEPFLYSGVAYNISSVYFDSQNITLDYTYNAAGPATTVLKVPVYNVMLHVYGIFGNPINATVNAEFYNGTKKTYHSGKNGTLSIMNVTYGYLRGDVNYSGVSESFSTRQAENYSVVIISYSDFIVIAILVIVIVATIVELGVHRVRRTRKRQ